MASRYDKIPSPEVTETGVASDPKKKEVGKWEDNGTGSQTWVAKPTPRPLDKGFSAPTAAKPTAKSTPKPKVTAAQIPEPPKKQGTQDGHAVTSGKNTTKPLTPADKQANAKRPAVGNDAAAAKKANGPSWNNGYTN